MVDAFVNAIFAYADSDLMIVWTLKDEFSDFLTSICIECLCCLLNSKVILHIEHFRLPLRRLLHYWHRS
jgi:hypothetical protein